MLTNCPAKAILGDGKGKKNPSNNGKWMQDALPNQIPIPY